MIGETEIQDQSYFPRVAIAFINLNNEYEYLNDRNGNIINFESQMTAEAVLIVHRENAENYYFIEIDYANNQGE
jgi:hypothetical protein